MDIGYLIEQLKMTTSILPSESEAALQYLIKSIYGQIKNRQVLKIPKLGFFQLKDEPLTRLERKGAFEKSFLKKILLFVPFNEGKGNIDKAFLNIEIDSIIDSSFENVDMAFSLGFNKPIIPNSSGGLNSFVNKIKDFKVKNNFKEKIDELLSKAEVIDDFNFITDLFSSSMDEEQNLSDLEDTVKEILDTNHDNEILDSKTELPSQTDITENSTEEIQELTNIDFSEEDIEKLFSDEELEKIPIQNETNSEFVTQTNEVEKTSVENSEPVDEEVLNLPTEQVEFVSDEKQEETQEKKKTMFDELEEVLSSKTDASEIIEELEIEKSKANTNLQSNTTIEKESTNKEKSIPFYKNFIFWFGAIIVIVLAVAAYFMLDGNFLKKENDVSKKKVSQKSDVNITKVDTNKLAQPLDSQKVNEGLNNFVTNKSEKENIYRTPSKDIRINNQIYFDGSKYSVQVSSWLNNSIAENEVKKLRARGFDAYIYKALVNNNFWSRVRIGYFNSKAEAEGFLINNQLKEN